MVLWLGKGETSVMNKTDPLEELKQAVIDYLDHRPDDEQGTVREWKEFSLFREKLEKLLGVQEGRWG
jgi:hypothetical protein